MNLKESYRYQKYLSSLMYNAKDSIERVEHAISVTKNHYRSKSNPAAVDLTEEIEPGSPFPPNDDVVRFMAWLVEERRKLSEAIGKAKANAAIDIDAATQTNRFRQEMFNAIRTMLSYNSSRTIQQGRDFCFDVNGVQAPYYYEVEVVKTENFDRDAARERMRAVITEADEISNEIDAALINTEVDYTPKYDINESFQDVMEAFSAEYCS